MKITYISSFDATDISSYSGTGYFIPHKLKESGDTVKYIGKLKEYTPIYQKVKRKLYELSGKNYLIERNPALLSRWGVQIEKQLDISTEVLVGYSSQPFAGLNARKPSVFWADAVFGSMIDYYPVYSNLCAESLRDGNAAEKAALDNVDIAVFSSKWAADAAVRLHGADPKKVRVVTYGANIDVDYNLTDIEEKAKAKEMSFCNLLFLGVEWERKGGDKAVEITRLLNENGLKAQLSIIGVDPGAEVSALDYVKTYGFVSKSNAEGKKLLNDVIANSHFLLLPTRADCTPIVYSEFNAHGIPVITTTEGGIPSIVTDGINGYMFDKDDTAETFSQCIIDLMRNKSKYVALSKCAFNEYKSRLNWNSAIANFRNVLKEVVE